MLLLALLAFACAAPTATTTPLLPPPTSVSSVPPTLPTATITIEGGHSPISVTVELPRTPLEFAVGLSRRDSLPEGAGMLFDYQGEVNFPFTMRDTRLPLSIAFISSRGIILELQDMEPLSPRDYYSQHPYRYALEVSRGFFSRHGIVPGSRLGDLPTPPPGTAQPFGTVR